MRRRWEINPRAATNSQASADGSGTAVNSAIPRPGDIAGQTRLQEAALGWLEQAATADFFQAEAMRQQAATDRDPDALRSLSGFREFCQRNGIDP